ncbi:MAG: MarR family transcriptional regulator [Clostridia bacterium]|nr:MarR family transcriptional regulator [Clostridia bacterium]
MDKYDVLKLENKICFPLYACSKEIVKRYRPYLDVLDLTYTQYLALMVVWEKREVNVKELGEKLYLDSGTLTPVLKNLEAKGYVCRTRSTTDERVLNVKITDKGEALKDKALDVPQKVAGCVKLAPQEAVELYRLLHKILGNM